ncbi:N-6 DNA methylase [Clostridium sporogenes]|uniref:N-6 DNA methylase n=1 Tax=Clostridium sporogenes TaxID=1509 RepID=UPI00313AA663
MSKTDDKEIIIKNRHRVKQHGEVFTPREVVRKMINLPGMKDAIEEFQTTVLEPAVGEGIFLVEILKKRFKKVRKECEKDLNLYENLSLLALTTLYGIELLEDNVQKCVSNIYQTFYDDYQAFVAEEKSTVKPKVLESAKLIISANIVQGNFLTKLTTAGESIVFSEWRIVKTKRRVKNIKVERTEFSLEEIMNQQTHEAGNIYNKNSKLMQLSIFDVFDIQAITPDSKEIKYKYVPVKITDVYKQEMEETYG